MDSNKIVFPRELQFDGCACFFGQHRSDQIGILILVLVAETAAHVMADHVYRLRRNPEIPGGVGTAVRDALGRCVQRQFVGVPGSDTRPGFHLCVLN